MTEAVGAGGASILPVTPIFQTHFSIGKSLLTIAEPGKAAPGQALSVFDLAQSAALKEVTIVDDRIDGFLAAYKVSAKLGLTLQYGIKFCVCSDLTDKSPQSRVTESKVILFVLNSQGYHDLLRIWSRAWTTGHVTFRRGGQEESYGRTDWRQLAELWTPNLMLALPYFSSFLAVNTLTFNRVVPNLAFATGGGRAPIWVLREMKSQLPFAPLIDSAIDQFLAPGEGPAQARVLPTKTILYLSRRDFKAYQVRRASHARGSYDAPEVPHLSSPEFCWEAWRELVVPAAAG